MKIAQKPFKTSLTFGDVVIDVWYEDDLYWTQQIKPSPGGVQFSREKETAIGKAKTLLNRIKRKEGNKDPIINREEIIKFTDQILGPSDSEVEAYSAGYEIGFEGYDIHEAYKKYFMDPVVGIHFREGTAFKDGWEDGLIDKEIGYGKSKKGGKR